MNIVAPKPTQIKSAASRHKSRQRTRSTLSKKKNSARKSGKNNSYIKDYFAGTQQQYEYLRELLIGVPYEDTYKFFVHILACSIHRIGIKEDSLVPVPYKTRIKYLKNSDWEWLLDRGLIKKKSPVNKPGIPGQGECRKYKPLNSIIDKYLQIGYESLRDPTQKIKRVNLFNGKKTTRTEKTSKNDENNHKHPELWCKAISLIKRTMFDDARVRAHLEQLKQELEQTIIEYNEAKESNDLELRKCRRLKLVRARGRYRNDLACYTNVRLQNIVQLEEGIYTFKPAYEPASTGRSQAIHGCFQSCTREMKQAAFGGLIDSGEVKNYDIKSSQPNILIHFIEDAGGEANWLRDYVNDPNAKDKFSDLAGLDVDSWKKCLLARVMGASKPSCNRQHMHSIAEYLDDYAISNGKDWTVLVSKFNDVTKELDKELKSWHDKLVSDIKKTRESYIKNNMGFTSQVSEIRKMNSQQKIQKLSAFYLQGKEAEFIAHLTILSEKYKYEVLQNEHDGLIVKGTIPEEAKEQAKQLARIDLNLVEKELC